VLARYYLEKLHPNRAALSFLNGESGLIHTLYECCAAGVRRSWCATLHRGLARAAVERSPRCAPAPVGFAEDEGMLPYPRRSFTGYRLLHE